MIDDALSSSSARLLVLESLAAIQTFQKALDLDTESVPLLTDAASDYGKAIELLGRALDKAASGATNKVQEIVPT